MTTADELPQHHVIAVIDGNDAARTAVQELQQLGFSESSVFGAEELENEVDAHGEKANLLTRIAKAIPNHLSEQVDYIAQYQELAKNGSSIVAVKVADREQAEQVRDILEGQGARNMRYFGTLAVADLTRASNPSAREDVRQ